MSTEVTTGRVGALRGGHARWIDDWRPEDEAFWRASGSRIARRNLIFSILSEHIGFSIWTMWSVLVLFLGPEYGIDPAGKFLLTAVPAAVGALVRLPYTLRGGGVRRPQLDDLQRRAAAGARASLTAIVLEPGRLVHDPAHGGR